MACKPAQSATNIVRLAPPVSAETIDAANVVARELAAIAVQPAPETVDAMLGIAHQLAPPLVGWALRAEARNPRLRFLLPHG